MTLTRVLPKSRLISVVIVHQKYGNKLLKIIACFVIHQKVIQIARELWSKKLCRKSICIIATETNE